MPTQTLPHISRSETYRPAILNRQQLHDFDENGLHVVRRLFTADDVNLIRETFMRQNANGPVEGLSEFRHGGSDAYSANDPLRFYPRMMHPHRHPDKPVGSITRRFMLDPRVGQILTDLFGEEPVAAQSMFYFKPPGARGQDLHQDNFYLRVAPGTCMAAWIAIDDADENNGGLMVVPGTNRMEIICPGKADATRFFTSDHVEPPPGFHVEPVRLQTGDVLFFNGSLIHGSYPNTSKDRFRRAFICHYLPKSSTELSQWYTDLLTFDGQVMTFTPAGGGGPCGTLAGDLKIPH